MLSQSCQEACQQVGVVEFGTGNHHQTATVVTRCGEADLEAGSSFDGCSRFEESCLGGSRMLGLLGAKFESLIV